MKRTLLALFVSILICQTAAQAQSQPSVLSKKQIDSAEKLITKLERFEPLTQNRDGNREHSTALHELSSSIYKSASRLPEGNLKTDITTAVHFYEMAALARASNLAAEHGGEGCVDEKPGAYQRLCEANSGSHYETLLAKARLHSKWAKAMISVTRSGNEIEDLVREIEVERINDRALGQRALAALKVLKDEVVVHSSLSDFEETGTIARVSYETFKRDLRNVSAEVERILSWLPQNRMKFEISNALYSYQDGGLGWSQIYEPRVVSVAELGFAEKVKSPSITAYQTTVPYTVAINWRQAGKYLDRAEALLNQ